MTEKEQAILLAAEEEFYQKGYDGASTATIAKSAGVTHAMVNYYFRTKENLFVTILDSHIHSLFSSLTPLMKSDIIGVLSDVSMAVFDKFNQDRKFPFILQDTARSHPEFLIKYQDIFKTTCLDSILRHSERLKDYINKGIVSQCSMRDICDTIISLVCAPFIHIPLLKNVAHLSDAQVEEYLSRRREEIKDIIVIRFSKK